MTNQEVTDLFSLWNDALKSRDPYAVAALYADDAIILPTISNAVRHNQEEFVDYFTQFLARGPKGELVEQNIRIINELAFNSGIYKFSFDDGSDVTARFTFVYQQQNGVWKIIEQHSSAMPESS